MQCSIELFKPLAAEQAVFNPPPGGLGARLPTIAACYIPAFLIRINIRRTFMPDFLRTILKIPTMIMLFICH